MASAAAASASACFRRSSFSNRLRAFIASFARRASWRAYAASSSSSLEVKSMSGFTLYLLSFTSGLGALAIASSSNARCAASRSSTGHSCSVWSLVVTRFGA